MFLSSHTISTVHREQEQITRIRIELGGRCRLRRLTPLEEQYSADSWMGRREGEPVTVDPELRYARHGRRPLQFLDYHSLFDGHRILNKAVVVQYHILRNAHFYQYDM
jgi:hypothetical protein